MDHPPHSAAGSALAVAAAMLLAGCSTFGGQTLDLACPKVGVLADAAHVTLFAPGSGHSPANVTARGTVADFSGKCSYDDTGVTVALSLALVAERGPALAGNQVAVDYFVALSQPDGTIAAKQVFPTTIDFKGNSPRAGTREDVQPHIPLPKGVDARAYQILLGFQLTQDQLDYNRRTAAK